MGGPPSDDIPAMPPSASVRAVDVHGHYGTWHADDTGSALLDSFSSGDAATVVARARDANTCLTVVSPLLALAPRGHGQVVAGNEEATQVVAETEGLLQWVVVSPLEPRSFDQAAELLQLPQCAGLKIHPEQHLYPISEQGRVLFEFAAKHGAIVLTHSGDQNSLPADYVPFANDFPEVTLILAHLGCGWDGDPTRQVRAAQSCRHANVFIDTSSAMNIRPMLIEWAAGEIGAERLLYGTDSPLYFAPMQRARIDHADLSLQEKQSILRENAAKLFQPELIYHSD